jgi:3-oxoacyl-[acyl-carrier protein] reductase
MNLANRVALVTGSGRGIGKAIALKLAENGADVVINDIGASADLAAQEVENLGRRSLSVKADVSNSTQVNQMIEDVVKAFGKIDILVNNAGIARDQISLRMSDEEWESVLNVNLKSVFFCTRAVLRPMIKQRWGRIVNISSISGIIGNPGQVNYSAAKAGIIGLTKTIAKEVASRMITVNAVAPGFIDTEMTQHMTDKAREEFVKRIPIGFLGSPADVAQAVAFFASEEARYITGQVLSVDGGLT